MGNLSKSKSIVAAIVAIVVAVSSFSSYNNNKWEDVKSGDAIVVTGSSSGIGKHAALSLVKQGYTVFACVRKERDGQALRETANKFHLDVDKLKPLLMDITNHDQIQQAVTTVKEYLNEGKGSVEDDGEPKRRLKGLFNNAGGAFELSDSSGSTSFEHMSMDVYRKTMAVNYFGPIEVTKAFLPLLKLQKGSRIVMNTSIAGFMAPQFMSAYSSSKFALEGFADAIRRELLPAHGIHVSILEPGLIWTKILPDKPPVGLEPYRDAERKYITNFIKNSMNAASPKVTSEAVVDAMRSASPKTRYLVGTMSGISWVLSKLPDGWVDFLLLNDPAQTITEQDKEKFIRSTQMEYEL